MPATGLTGFWHWLLLGWRQAIFSVLAVYAIAAVVFLTLGGAAPESSMQEMEDEIVTAAENTEGTDSGASTPQSRAGNCKIDPANLTTSSRSPTGNDNTINPNNSTGNDTTTGSDTTTGNPNTTGRIHQITFTTLDTAPAALSAYAGCPLLINFFASWCVPCVTEMPDFEQFWQLHGHQVAVVGLAVEQAEPARAIVAETGVTYPVGVDDDNLFIDLGGVGMPTTVFVSADGDLLESHSGILTFDDLVSLSAEHFELDDYFDQADFEQADHFDQTDYFDQ